MILGGNLGKRWQSQSSSPFAWTWLLAAMILPGTAACDSSADLFASDSQVEPSPIVDFRFDSYQTTGDLHDNQDGLGMSTNHETDVTLDVTESPDGGPRHSMLYTYPDLTGDPSRCNDRTVRTTAGLPDGITEVWVELVVKFEEGFTTVAPAQWDCASAPELKLLFINHKGAGSGGVAAGRHGMHVGTFGNDRVFIGTPHGGSMSGTADRSLFDGQWHTFRLHARLPSTPNSDASTTDGSADGRFRMWWNGSLDIDLQNVSTSAAEFSGLWFGANMNQGQGDPQRLWWNRMRVWTDDPGW